ncbi:DNA cytosine methyltransferase, partial [Cytobacillus praedii]
MNKLKVLSLFSGIGAFEEALKKLNIHNELVNYCEFDPIAAKAYSLIHNVPEEMNLGDITQVDETVLNDFDLMTYGFPCQDISALGDMKGLTDDEG